MKIEEKKKELEEKMKEEEKLLNEARKRAQIGPAGKCLIWSFNLIHRFPKFQEVMDQLPLPFPILPHQ